MTRKQRDTLCRIAGFFMGYGSLFIQRTGARNAVIAFYQDDWETLDFVSNYFGDSTRALTGNKDNPSKCLKYGGRKVFRIVRELFPYLWGPKGRKAAILLENAHLWLSVGRGKHCPPGIMDARLQVANSVNNPYKGKHRAKPVADDHNNGNV